MSQTPNAAQAINQFFENLINIGTFVGLSICVAFVVWAGIMFMTAEGNPVRMERAKGAIVAALAGFAIVLMARIIAGLVQNAFQGVSAGGPGA